jgi:tRNA (uracil-5-)-methyltransferase
VVTVVDPPRAGLHPAVVKALRACPELRRLVFVSCHAPAFVHNAVGLCRPTSAGFPGAPFVLRRAAPVDLFPDTEHCELVVLLEREDVLPAAPAAAAAAAAAIDDGATRDARGEEQGTQGGEGGGPAPKKARLCHD